MMEGGEERRKLGEGVQINLLFGNKCGILMCIYGGFMTQEMVINEVRKLKSPELLDTLYLYIRFLLENRKAPIGVFGQKSVPYEDFKSEDEMNEFISGFAKEYFDGR
jgi:hypothetical protein